MTNQTLQNDDNNRDNKTKNEAENELRPLWLRSEDYAQTPRSELINYLLGRYKQVKWALLSFKSFPFTPKQPAKSLIL